MMGRFAIGPSLTLALAAAFSIASAGIAMAAAGPMAPPQSSAKAPKPKKTVDPDQMVCKTVQSDDDSHLGGSRLGGEKECLTRAQWDERSHQDAQMLDQMSHTGTMGH